MALQDLTPQLRTRLSRMERAVGWFVMLAAALLVSGFIYYVYHTAERKGWFKIKATYYTYTSSASGLKIGDPVVLMGLEVGQITEIQPESPEKHYNMYVEFAIKEPYYGYIWTEGSRVRINAAGFLGARSLEVTKGLGGYASYIFQPLRLVGLEDVPHLPDLPKWVIAQEVVDPHSKTWLALPKSPLTNLAAFAAAGLSNLLVMDTRPTERSKLMTGVWNDQEGRYEPFTNQVSKYRLVADESPPVTEQLQKMAAQVELALPNFLRLTNQLQLVLSNSAHLTANLDDTIRAARPALTNLAVVTAQLDHPGALGEWLLPTNVQRQLEGTLQTAQATMANADTNLTALLLNLDRSLDHLAAITSNLNNQVEANTNLLSAVSDTIVHADQFIQGLKRHWLLRSAFKPGKTNSPAPAAPPRPLRAPKEE